MSNKTFLALALAALLAIGASLPAKAETPDVRDAATVLAFGAADTTTMFMASMSAGGGGIFVGALGAIAYCQATMQKNAAGVVTYQNPKCNGGSPTPIVGNLTQNAYVTPPNPCTKSERGVYVCAR